MTTSVFTIDPDQPFVDLLAAGVMARVGDADPLALSRAIILLPTRRACRTLRDAFLRQGGGRPMLLPRLMTLGDLDEDEALFADGGIALDLPPAVTPLRRRLLMARLILAARGGGGVASGFSPDQAVRLAGELGRLLDQVHTERLSLARLVDLVPQEYAAHWQITLEFLKILTEYWPRIVAEEGVLDVADRHNQLAAAQAEAWLATPPLGMVLAAGSTGSVPATADLLKVVAALPQGAVVLPGLDRDMDAESWEILEETHPQFGLKRLLEHLGVERALVPDWQQQSAVASLPADSPGRRLVSEAMRPAGTTHRWQGLQGVADAARFGLLRLDCPGPREEGLAIALMLRETLEHPGMTAALITPDRALARRVAAELTRWGIAVDDSAGRPLSETPPGIFLHLCARMVADAFSPVSLLSACKHPLAAGGDDVGAFRDSVRLLERRVLRGARPAAGLTGIGKVLRVKQLPKEEETPLAAWLDRMSALARPFVEAMAESEVPLPRLVKAHMEFAEALAATATESGSDRLWCGEAGEMAAHFAADLITAARDLPSLPPQHYPAMLESLMSGLAVRPRHGGHPRLAILGPLEARLQQADLLVLGGLNEGTWPPQTVPDPWMSRPMRSQFGLPLPERRVGLSAHDFAQACCAPRVVLTRALRVEGTPTVPSRWLLRLDAVLRACGVAGAMEDDEQVRRWLTLAVALDQPTAFVPVAPPVACPPLAARPRVLSVTEIETWMRDPYAIYAKRVLRLGRLDPLEFDPGVAEYGSLVHRALELFMLKFPNELPDDAEAKLAEIGEAVFADLLATPGVWAFWWPRFRRIGGWVVAMERERRSRIAVTHTEIRGSLVLSARGGPFTLKAKADRIDVLRDGTLAILDYKTGKPPSQQEVAAGYAPQLPLEGEMARRGVFGKLGAGQVSELTYWQLKGSNPGGEEKSAGKDIADMIDQAIAGLQALIDSFDNPETPYEARPNQKMAPEYSDYMHLARVKEWATATDESE